MPLPSRKKAAEPRPNAAPAAAYDEDFYGWALEQGALLRAGRLDKVDLENVAEEIETLGRGQFDKLVSLTRLVLLPMLKWEHQPNLRSRSWALSIETHRAPRAGRAGRESKPETANRSRPGAGV